MTVLRVTDKDLGHSGKDPMNFHLLGEFKMFLQSRAGNIEPATGTAHRVSMSLNRVVTQCCFEKRVGLLRLSQN